MEKGDRTMCQYTRNDGFTLVELSIVLVIVGLLVGGVLAGHSLIRASELRAISSEHQRYVTAVNAFRDKYFAIPGDMTNASSFWTTLSGGNNGNGDGNIPICCAGPAGTSTEQLQFWNMLSLAGLIEGKFTGVSGSTNGYDHVPGSNCPRSKFPSAGWSVLTSVVPPGDPVNYVSNNGNTFDFGATYVGGTPFLPVLKAEDAWNIDSKIDDGKPGTGRILIVENATWGGAAGSKCTTSSSATDYAGNYNLSNIGISCALRFIKSF